MKRALLLFSVCIQLTAYGQLQTWELSAQPGNQVSNTASTNAAGTNAGLLSRGAGVTASAAAGCISSSGWFSSSAATTLADAIANNDYYEFTLPVQAGNTANVTSVGVVVRSSNTGPNTATLRSSADGFTANLGTIPITTASVLNNIPLSLNGLSGTVTFRLYGYGAAANAASTPASTGTFRIGTSVVAIDNDLLIAGVVCSPYSATLGANSTVICGSGTGQIFFNLSGGAGPYSVVYNNGSNNITVNNYVNQSNIAVGAGTYTAVSATDANGCPATTVTGTVTVQFSSGPSIGATSTNPTCANNDGQINLTISGGVSPYTFNWSASNGGSGIVQGQEDQTTLSAGSYAVTVTDNLGCTATGAFTLTLPANCGCPALATSVINTTCNTATGSITVIPTGGTPPFQYNIGNGAQSSPTFSNLAAGTYTITVTGNSCAGVTVSATVQVAADVQPPTFNPPLPQNITINCNDPVPPAATLTATDNCTANPAVTFNQQTTNGACPQEKTITRTWTATDASGNSAQHTQTITVVDDTPPVFNQPLPPANLTVSCDAPLPMPATVTAADNCDPGNVPPVIFINEIHYDNTGVDVNEFVEIAGTAGLDLTQYQIILYNGNGGVTYDTRTLAGTIDNEGNGFGAVAFTYPSNGIQNGTPDGLALVKLPGTVIQFLSYEGPFLATNGPAAGMTATDIGVIEDGANAVGTSLQLTGTGQQYANFTWVGPITATPNTLNAGQTVNPLPGTITAVLTESMMMGDCDGEMTVMRMYTATDACGNATTHTQTIHVEDFTPPTFAPPLPQNITIECNTTVPPPATLIATDNCDDGTPDMAVWINEIHYDNVGTDDGEFIEVAGTAGTDLSEYSLFLYNGTGGGTYGSMTLSGTIDNESNGFGAVHFPYPVNGIQNGSPDGVALVHGGMVVQFLSYEGTFVAVGGPANGMPSTDIGVLEDGTNAIGTSLRLSGNGNMYQNFTWNPPAAATPGTINTGQTFVPLPGGLVVTFNQITTPGNCPQASTITRTWSVADGCGNSTSLVQVVTIRDATPPVFTFVPPSSTQQCTANVPPLGTPTVSDNCDLVVPIVYFGETITAGNCPNSQIVTRRWSATDDCGNVATASQVISVNDNQGPTLVCQNITVDLNIFGTVSVATSSLIQTLSDNCSANSAITVSPVGPLTFGCAQAGTTVPVMVMATDQCGNKSTCTAQVTVNPFPRCTPKILISDPCVCKNNATTLDNGQFGETLKVESLAGKTWTLIAVSGLYSVNSPAPPGIPVPLTLGTQLVENPANSGDYYLSGIHVDVTGYSLTVRSETGQVLTISNACKYPNPSILSDLSGPFCLFSDTVNLVGDPGDANIVSAEFTVNGTTTTVFNPANGVGQYIIVYTVNGGTPKAAGPDDPGCIQSVQTIVNVLATPSVLTCNDLVEISLDEDCSAVVEPDMILEGTYFCFDDYKVEITDLDGVPSYGNTVSVANLNQTLKATVTHLVSGNTCWGNIFVEDKLPPKITCSNITLSCGITNYDPDYLRMTLGIQNALPIATDNCTTVTLSYNDDFVDLACGANANGVQDVSAYVRRVWTATDANGLKATCTQFINLKRKHVADVLFPPDVTISCENPVTDPSATGTPYIKDFGMNIPMYPETALCELQTGYQDQILPVCDGSYKILRTWTVLDWCLPTTPEPPYTNPTYFIQVIKVLDTEGPTFTCPANLTVSTDATNCCSTADLPDIVLSDACSYPKSASARIVVRDPVTNALLETYDVDATFADFPGNNWWNPDTLAVFGYTPCVRAGAHTVTYRVEDNCGNTRTCTFRLTVDDRTPPVAVCDEFTNVSLGVDGTSLVNATTFDDGSYDNCGEVHFKARRMTTGCNQSNSQFYDQVEFCCDDIGKTITVVLRVYDVTVSDGAVSLAFQELDANDCMVQVFVEDKIKPYCKSPANVTVSCENFDPSLWAYGSPTVDDNCCVDTVTSSDNYSLFDTVCHRGTITRTFRVFDCGGQTNQCSQRIAVTHEQDYYIRFPNDVIVPVCDGTGNYGEPTFFGEDCELLGVSFEDETFDVVPDACFKIERTWTIINWCTYNPNIPCTYVPNPNPNATVNHPSNLPGPTVSAPGTLAPWTSTVVKINASDPQPTNYSIFWNANTNCYTYKQIIKILDTQDPVLDCAVQQLVLCDLPPNNPQFWNQSYWWDPVHETHDLCETPIDISIVGTDLCTKEKINFRYLLFLDLNNDGDMETVVNSVNPPAPGTVNFGNAATPNYSGGTPQQFDQRPVPANQKYQFTLQTFVSGNSRTAQVMWSTPQAPNVYTTPILPFGTHKIKWISEDGCGNETVCEQLIEIKDCKKPTVACINGLSVNIMPTKMVQLWASDFLKYGEDNCTPANQLVYGIRKAGAGTDFPFEADGVTPQTSVTFTCDELGTQIVELWAMDKAGNADYCETYVIVQDPNKICITDFTSVAGALKTEQQQGLSDASVQLSGSHPALPPVSLFNLTGDNGSYAFNAVPLGGNYTVTPTKDNDPLNGVSTYDLVLINKHILGLEPLSSPFRMIAADANNSRSVTTFDVVELRKLILGIYTELPNNTAWRFVDKTYVFPNPGNPFEEIFPETMPVANFQGSLSNGDFTAVKVGDVNGNAVPNSSAVAEERSSETLYFDVVAASAGDALKAGEIRTVTFRAAEKVAGYQFTLSFPDLELLDILPGTGMSAANFGAFPAEHALTTSFDPGAGAQQAAEFTLRFRARVAGSLSRMLMVSSRITRAEGYLSAETSAKADIALRFGGAGTPVISTQGFELYQNQPNPWTSKTQIGFYLPEAASATLRVMDQTGRLLATRTGDFAKGFNRFTLEKAGFETAGGVLYYQVETAEHRAAGKMIMD